MMVKDSPALALTMVVLVMTAMAVVAAMAGGQRVWYKVLVSQTNLDSNVAGNLKATSAVRCAIKANQHADAHIITFNQPDICTFYNLIVRSSHDDSATGDAQECWTWHEKECEDGEMGILPGCTYTHCQQGVFQPYQDNLAPNVSFSELLSANCIHLEKTGMNWYDARNNCISLGGDLFVPGDYPGAQHYIDAFDLRRVWLGGMARIWLDGRPVPDQMISDGSSKPTEAIHATPRMTALADVPYTVSEPSLCMKGVSYP